MPVQSSNPPDVLTLEQWKGLNQQVPRASIDDNESWWLENFFILGQGALRTCYGPGPAIYTAPSGVQILRIFFGSIGYPTPEFSAPPPGAFGWMFRSDGVVDQVDLDTGAVTTIGQIWQPIAPQYYASAKVWRPKFYGSKAGQNGGVLFGSPLGYYAWDGQTLSSPGQPAPDWLTDLAETAPSQPVPPMPSGLPGIYAMEVYASRVWVVGKDVCSFSAPSNGADFSTVNGGGSFGYFGDRLTYSWADIAASAGYLYFFGDSSTDALNNVTLVGGNPVGPTSPLTTNFNYYNVDPQVGQRFPRPVGRDGRYLAMFNDAGIWLMEGAAASPIADKITRVWRKLDTSLYYPTFAPATLFNFRVLLVNGRFTDPWGVKRNLQLFWHPTKGSEHWSVGSQGMELTNIGSYEQDSCIRPFGTDGTSLYPLYHTPDPNLIKRLSTKWLRGSNDLAIKNLKRIYTEISDEDGRGVSITGQLHARGGGVPGGSQPVAFNVRPGQGWSMDGVAVNGGGVMACLDLESKSPDFTIERIFLSGEERTIWGA